MAKLRHVVKKGRLKSLIEEGLKSLEDSNLLKALRSEIEHENETGPTKFEDDNSGSLGDFKLEWDSKSSQDVLLRKKSESGEDVVVSALLSTNSIVEDDAYLPREVLMKVCIKKPALSSILQLDCQASSLGLGKSSNYIQNACCIQSASTTRASYGHYLFRKPDPKLRDGLHKYLEARGIGESLTNFLLLHLHKKEQDQYVEWLHKLKDMVAEKRQ